jgi:hypothetical protein
MLRPLRICWAIAVAVQIAVIQRSAAADMAEARRIASGSTVERRLDGTLYVSYWVQVQTSTGGELSDGSFVTPEGSMMDKAIVEKYGPISRGEMIDLPDSETVWISRVPELGAD